MLEVRPRELEGVVQSVIDENWEKPENEDLGFETKFNFPGHPNLVILAVHKSKPLYEEGQGLVSEGTIGRVDYSSDYSTMIFEFSLGRMDGSAVRDCCQKNLEAVSNLFQDIAQTLDDHFSDRYKIVYVVYEG